MPRPHQSLEVAPSAGETDGLRELTALATLPAIWRGREPDEIARSLAEALFAMLRPALVYIAVRSPAREVGYRAACVDDARHSDQQATLLAAHLAPFLTVDCGDAPQTITHPLRNQTLRLVTLPIGHDGAHGIIAAAAPAPLFPRDIERVLLNVAANQVTIALESAHQMRSLRDSEARLRISYENAPLGVAETAPDGRLLYANPKFCALTGYTRDELLQKHTRDITHPDDRAQDQLLYQRLLAGEIDSYEREKRYLRKDGTPVWARLSLSLVRDAARVPQYAVGIIEDISGRKRAEEERARLLDSEREARTEAELLNHLGRILNAELKLEKLVQSVTDVGTALCGAQFGAFFYNAVDSDGEHYVLHTVSGVEREAFAKFPVPRVTKLFEPTFSGREVVRLDDVTRDARYGQSTPHRGMPAGHLPVTSYLAVPVVSRSGEVIGALLFGHAEPARFSERHARTLLGVAAHAAVAVDNARLFERVVEREERLRVTTEHAPVGIGECALDGRFLAVNRKFCEITGYSEQELLGRRFSDITHPDDRAPDLDNFQRLTAGEVPWYRREKRYVRKDGAIVWIDLTVSLARDAAGKPRYGVGVIEDITARKQAEAAARASEAELERMADAVPALIGYVGADGRYQFTNEAYHAWFGKTRAQTLGQHVRDVVGAGAYAAIRDQVEQALAGTPATYERWVPYAGCGLRFVRASLTPRLSAAGKPDGFFVLVTDLTATKHAEQRNQFLAEVSTVLAGSLGDDSALQQLAALAVPQLADWCAVDIQSDDGQFARVALAHADADKLATARALMERYPPNTTAAYGTYSVVRRVLQSGTAQWLAEAPDDLLRSIAKDEEHLAALRSFGFRSFVCAPLMVRDRAIGAVTFVYADSERRYAASDVELIQEVARRAAIAVDNARLYTAAQRELAERRATEQALRESEARFQAVFANALDAVMLADDEGRYVDVNPAACALLGFTREQLLESSVEVITPPAKRAELPDLWRDFRARGEQTGEYELMRADGSVVAVAYRAVANILPGLHVSVLIDITERKRAERQLEARARQQETVALLGRAALEHEDLAQMLQMACDLIARTLEVELCKVLELEPNGAMLRLRAGVGWNEGLLQHATVGAGADSQAGYTLKVDAPVVVLDLATETRFRGPPLLFEHGVVSGMSVTIAGDEDQPYGVLGVHTRSTRTFTQEDVNFLESVGHVLATAIQRQRVAEALRQARDDLEERVIERTAELAKANETLRDEIVERMGVEAALRDSEAQYRLLFERNPLPAWVFDLDTRDILAANETAVWRYGYTRDELLRMAIHDLHPPEDQGRPLDYVEKFPPETAYVGLWRHRKQDDTVIDVEMFVYEVLFRGRWARLVLANDITERKRVEEEMRLIEGVTRAINDAPDLDSALQATLVHLGETTGWLLGEAWVPNEHGDSLQLSPAFYAAAKGFDSYIKASKRWRVKQGTGLIGQAWTSRQPVWVTDVGADPRFKRGTAAAEVGIRSAVAFPIHAGDRLVAVLAFYMRESRREDDRQVKLVSTIATQVGLAIQRKQAEEALRESEERFRLLVEGARDYGIYMLDPEGRVATWNAGAERIKGYTANEIIGKHFSCFFADEDVRAGLPQKNLARALADGSVETEGWRLRKDGTRIWASVVLTVLRDTGGGVRGFVKLTRDTTERRTTEQRLRDSEARLARAQEFSLLMVAHADLDGRWLKVPKTLCALLGYTEKELLAGQVKGVTHVDDFDAEWALCQRLIRGEAKSFDLEKRFLRRDGKAVWVYQNTSIVLDAEDRPLHFLSFLRDITSRKEAEDQLRKSRMQLLEAQRLAHLGSWEWDVGSGAVEWSEELYRIYGLPPDSGITYERYLAQVHADDRVRVVAEIETAVRNVAPFSFEERILRADGGGMRYLHSQGAVIANDRGQAERVVGVCLDITERKHAEERVREYASRLASLSTRLLEAQETERRSIARELHDQIGQDLSVIKINLQALQRLPGGAVAAQLDETLRIVESVLGTARNLSLDLRPSMLDDLGLPAALRWYLDRQAQRGGFAVQLLADPMEARIAPAIETTCFRVTQEAVTNIMRHAQATRVVVEVRHDGETLLLRISDDGKGFDVAAARARAAGGGSFGVLGMEERTLLAGGTLEISSAPGQGTKILAHFALKGAA